MPGDLIKSASHLQTLKFGTTPDPTKSGIQNQLIVEEAIEKGINNVGINLTYLVNRALFAVQKLFDKTDYKGNALPKGSLPRLVVPISEYLDAFGARKSRTARGKMEYSSEVRKSAVDALQQLSEIPHLITYERKERIKGKSKGQFTIKKEYIEHISSLIFLKRVKNNLEIIPSQVLIDQIDKYYCWLPADLYDICDSDLFKVLFIEYLNYHYDMERKKRGKKSFEMAYQVETWAYKLRMDAFIKNRQWARIRSKLNQLYEFGKSLGLISNYKIDQKGKTVENLDIITLNTDAFAASRSTRKSSKVCLSQSQGLPVTGAKESETPMIAMV